MKVIVLQGALIHCNIYLNSLHRLEVAVANALQRWQIQQQDSKLYH